MRICRQVADKHFFLVVSPLFHANYKKRVIKLTLVPFTLAAKSRWSLESQGTVRKMFVAGLECNMAYE